MKNQKKLVVNVADATFDLSLNILIRYEGLQENTAAQTGVKYVLFVFCL